MQVIVAHLYPPKARLIFPVVHKLLSHRDRVVAGRHLVGQFLAFNVRKRLGADLEKKIEEPHGVLRFIHPQSHKNIVGEMQRPSSLSD